MGCVVSAGCEGKGKCPCELRIENQELRIKRGLRGVSGR